MNKFEELVRLKGLEGKASGLVGKLEANKGSVIDTGYGGEIATFFDYRDAEQYAILRPAASWLLDVAGAFQPGDATILRLLAEFLEHFKPDGHLNDEGDGAGITNTCAAARLRRLQAAAEEMER